MTQVTLNNGSVDSAGSLVLKTNGTTTAVTIDTSQNVGVGVTPSAWGSNYSKALQLSTQGAYVAGNTSSYSAGTYAWFGNNGYLDSAGTFRYTSSTSAAQYSQVANTHIWSYAASGTAGNAITFTEAMRIDSSGRLLVGTTNVISDGRVVIGSPMATTNGLTVQSTSTSGTATYVYFLYNGTGTGAIQSTGTTTSYGTTSDYRLKENPQPMQNALATVAQLKPCTYTWKADGSAGQGFIAHELQAVVPDCVTGEKDAVETYIDEDGVEQTRPVYQGIDTSFLVATLTAAIQELAKASQEQQAQISSQAAVINNLTERLAALEAK